MKRLVASAVLAAGLLLPAAPAMAQDGPGDVPTQDIIPEPNSGVAPEEAGDRGGALQLGLFGLVTVVIAGGGTHVFLQSRKARAARDDAAVG